MTEPETKSITSEELATRVRRVVGRRFRRDPALKLDAAPILSTKLRDWTTHGYDFLVISLAIFLVSILALNLSIAGSWQERGNQWGDRVAWQRELNKWEQQLVKQEQQLAANCQQLATVLISHLRPDEQQQALNRIKELRQGLRDANLSLVALRGDNQTIDEQAFANNPGSLSTAGLLSKRALLIEQQDLARSQYQAQHPMLQALEQQLQDLERQIAQTQEASREGNNDDPTSRIQVVENQFLRNASNSPAPATEPQHSMSMPQLQLVEQRFNQLRSTADRFLRDIETQQQSLQLADQERAHAWDQVANALRAMTRACMIPAALQQVIAQQNELRQEPTLGSGYLLLSLGLAFAVTGGIFWRTYDRQLRKTTPNQEQGKSHLDVNTIASQLGCKPGAIVPWELPTANITPPIDAPVTAPEGKNLQHKARLASECLLATAIAATVLLALTHGQFGDWLVANPLTAWGRWLGS